jgi:hypothetical protein
MINLSEEVLQHLRDNSAVSNFSDWVEVTYRATFPMEKNLKAEIENLKKKLLFKKKELKNNVKKEPKSSDFMQKYDEKTQKILSILYSAIQKGFDSNAVYLRGRTQYGLELSKKDFDNVMNKLRFEV